MSLHRMFDAAYPPAAAYPGSDAVAGYIGGNTPHIWTLAEWQRFLHLVQFPIWVGYQESDPVTHGQSAAKAMRDLGWRPNAEIRRACILDFETEVNTAWVDTFASEIWTAGYETLVYGSADTVVNNPEKEGRWIALYDNQASIPPLPGAIGHQYRANVAWESTHVDLSVISDDMMVHGGQGERI